MWHALYRLDTVFHACITLPFQNALMMLAIVSVLRNGHVLSSDILVTNNPQCTEIGKRLLQRNASIAQTYIAISLCEGIVHPMDSGLGGGFQAIIYNYHNSKTSTQYLMAREYSPYARAFVNRPLLFGNSIGIPSVLAGYARLLGVNDCLVKSPGSSSSSFKYYSQDCIDRIKTGVKSGFGNHMPSGVAYYDIFRDCIHLARYGFRVSPTFAAMYSYLPIVSTLIPYNSVTGKAINLPLANFIEFLSGDPLRLLDPYVQWANRRLSKNQNIRDVMLEDVHYFNSKLTSLDFISYKAQLRRPLTTSFHYRNITYKLLTMPSPAGGEPVAFFAKMVETINKLTHRRGIHASLTDEQNAVLFIICSKYAYSIKPYFRQLKQSTKRNLIVVQAPRIARILYRKVSRANESMLIRLINHHKNRVNSNFGVIRLPQIRVKQQWNRSRLSSMTTMEQDDEPDEDANDGAEDEGDLDFSEDNENEEEDDSLKENIDIDEDNDEIAPLPADSTSAPPLYELRDEALLSDFTNAMSSVNMSQFYNMIDNDEEDGAINQSEFEGGADDNPYGTTNVVVKKGRHAIIATSSINHSYGSGIASTRLGIFYNNVLRDSTPNSYYQRSWLKNGTKKFFRFPNRIRPHAVPSSSMGCTLLINPATHNPVFGIGGAGGFKITGAIFNVLWNYFIQGLSLNESVNRLRLITKINYKRNVTEIWYELPSHINATLIATSSKDYSFKQLEANFSEQDRPHALEFFHRHRNALNVFFIKEAGYSAVTAFTTLRSVVMGSYDNRRGGQVYINV